jgi:tRNA 2-thiocytidine biosynthesis protein TtcA
MNRASLPLTIVDDRPFDTRSRKRQYNTNKLIKRLRRQVGQAVTDYNMIADGDRVMVCLSGGKLHPVDVL